MKGLRFVLLGLALGSAVSMADDCGAPDAPQVPEGEDSSLEQMLTTQKSVKEFQAANLAYMSCLKPMLATAETEAKEGRKGATESYQKILEMYNAAVSKEEEVAGKFNTELHDYTAANPG